jgi:hypothetical protein
MQIPTKQKPSQRWDRPAADSTMCFCVLLLLLSGAVVLVLSRQIHKEQHSLKSSTTQSC